MKTGTTGLKPVLAVVLSCAALCTLMATPAQADIEYPWCAIYSEATVGATNCGFQTLAQCRDTISGIGGYCTPNPAHVPAASSRRKPRPRR